MPNDIDRFVCMKRYFIIPLAFCLLAELLSAQSVGTAKPGLSTATANVHLVDSAFYLPQLNRHRRIWIYLPEDYEKSRNRYPVLYMHDGQNLFDAATSYAGEWGVDEAIDSLPVKWIIVGIDNGQQYRMKEYNVFDEPKFGQGEGRAYLDFIVRNLKPHIDRHYRTKRTARNTAIAGSSMGALISFYAGLYHPAVFGQVGVFSPSFWINPNMDSTIRAAVKEQSRKSPEFYFYGGQQESESMVADMQKTADLLAACTGKKYTVMVNAEGRHNEAAWRREFPAFLHWLSRH